LVQHAATVTGKKPPMHPSRKMYADLMKEIVSGLMETGLWHKLNSAEGHQFVSRLSELHS
jgi:hypothetical protein